jgi:hypothetical protein
VGNRRQALLLITLSMVMGVHLVIIWLLLASQQLVIKKRFGGLQLVWIPRRAPLEAAAERDPTAPAPKTKLTRDHTARSPAPSSVVPRSNEEDNAIHPTPDWTEELQQAAKNAVANQLAQKRHELDFAHAFPVRPTPPPQIAWDYAATHRVEAIPGGGMLVHLSDNCVLILFPFPFVGCGIGKRPVNGGLFEHLRDQ